MCDLNAKTLDKIFGTKYRKQENWENETGPRNLYIKVFTAQQMKFSIKKFSVNVTKSTVFCGFGHIN